MLTGMAPDLLQRERKLNAIRENMHFFLMIMQV